MIEEITIEKIEWSTKKGLWKSHNKGFKTKMRYEVFVSKIKEDPERFFNFIRENANTSFRIELSIYPEE